MASRSQNTMVEGLQKLAQDITALKFAPDADVSFLIGLETQVLQKLREPFEAAAGQMGPPPGNAVDMGASMAGAEMAVMPGGGGGMPMGAPGPGGPMPASVPGGAMRQSPDMMRRALSGMGVQGG
jgi:hypothetical protein